MSVTADDRRGTAVGGRAAVEEAERPGDHRRVQHLLLGHLHLQVRELVPRAVPVVLDGDLGERAARQAELVHVAVRREREQAGRGVALAEDLVADARDAAAGAVLQLLRADDEHDVVLAGRDREARVAERVGAGGAEVLDPRDGPIVEAQRIGERDARLAALAVRQIGADVGRVDLARIDLRVGVRLEGRVADLVLVGRVVEVAELRAADADHGHLVADRVHSGRAFQK